MMSIVASYFPWCRFLEAQEGVRPQLYPENQKRVASDLEVLLRAGRFATGYVRMVGQERSGHSDKIFGIWEGTLILLSETGLLHLLPEFSQFISGCELLLFSRWIAMDGFGQFAQNVHSWCTSRS